MESKTNFEYMQCVDDFVMKAPSMTKEIQGKWVIAKPEPRHGLWGLRIRIKHALHVLRGTAIAVFYREDNPF